MTDNVKHLDVVKPLIDQSIIDALSNAVEEAKEGRLVEFYLVARLRGGRILTANGGDSTDVFTMYGALMHAAIDYGNEHID